MYKVILSTPNSKEAHAFPDKPAAMNCAVQLLRRHGSGVEVLIEDTKGIVFAHHDILRTVETVRP